MAFVRLDVISEKGWHLGKLTTLTTTISCLALFLLMNSTVARGEDGQDSREQIDCSGGGYTRSPLWTSSRFIILSPEQIDCSEGGHTQREMNTCAAREASHEQEKLCALVNEVCTTLGCPELAQIQQLWLEYQERHCKWRYERFAGGSIAPLIYFSCVASMTEERISRLKYMLCEGDGMTGSCAASEKYD